MAALGRIAVVVGALALMTASFVGGWVAHRPPRALDTTTTEDRNRDGRPDRWVERDSLGRVAKVRDDVNRDGFAERVEIYVDGKLNRVDQDSNGDLRYDTTDQLGSDGRVLFTYTDRNWNTLPERWVQLNTHAQVTAEWIDANEDTAPERYRSFDGAGRLLEEGSDDNADGLFEVNRSYNPHWPAGSHPLRVEHDDDGDGVFERRESYTREGVLRSINADTDHDGTRDHITLVRPDGSVRKEGFDRDGDGFFEEWRYPLENRSFRAAYDEDEDYDLDRWDPPGPPPGWCEARCAVRARCDP